MSMPVTLAQRCEVSGDRQKASRDFWLTQLARR
jgi:hypothetical protein